MNIVRNSAQLVWKFFKYLFVFMVNPKAVIYKEVDDQLEENQSSVTKK